MHYGKRFGRSPSVQGRVGRRDCPRAHRRPERVAVARDVARVDPYPVLLVSEISFICIAAKAMR